MKDKGILVVSFGSSIKKAREKGIESVEDSIKKAFKDYEVRRAFTSNMIIRKLKEECEIDIYNPLEGLTSLIEEGYKEVIVQPLHILPGYEYEKIEDSIKRAKHMNKDINIRLGRPVLFYEKDYEIAINALKEQLPQVEESQAIILMGHGTEHFANACYYCLQSYFNEENLPIFIANVEGTPSIENIILKLKKKNINKVYLMPYMLVAGDHAMNDMAGDTKDSWKNLLLKDNIDVQVIMSGLGENTRYHDIYIQHIKDCIDN